MIGQDLKTSLLDLARRKIQSHFDGNTLWKVMSGPEELFKNAAVFVTLTLQGELRGCIGSLQPWRPLWEDVGNNAHAAAFQDPRFPPVEENELSQIKIEISLLTPSQEIHFSNPEELISLLQPRVHGVIFQYQGHRSTFLPQVWDQLPDPLDFLNHLCLKAGTKIDDWRKPGVMIQVYEVEKWKEV